MIDIRLLGTGGGMPMPKRFLSSMIMSYKGRKILFDCGEGTQVSMRAFKTGFKSIDLILISHCHGDHIFGLPGLLSTMGNSERREPLTIIGPLGIEKILKGLLLAIPNLPYDINIIENPKNSIGINFTKDGTGIMEEYNDHSDIILNTVNLVHSSPCLGYSIYASRKPEFLPEKAETYKIPKQLWGKLQNGENVNYDDKEYTPDMVLGPERKGIKITYITDTRPTDSIIEFVKESDLFICEGTYGDNEDIEKAIMNKHMTFAEAAELAYKANVDKLLLTHFSTAMDDPSLYKNNAKDIFPKTIIGYDGYSKTLQW